MNERTTENADRDELERDASDWVLRMDRGLTAEEQDRFTEWLAADPRHREIMRLYQRGWDEFDRLAGLQATRHAQVDPDLLAPPSGVFSALAGVASAARCAKLWAALPLAAALALGFFAYFSWFGAEEAELAQERSFELVSRIEQRALPDGSRVVLNRGASIETAFTSGERRVRLARGEAVFSVSRDPNRPFVVEVAGVDVQAVGTVFNVRYARDRVDVFVSEGKVDVRRPDGQPGAHGRTESVLLELRQRAVVDLNLAATRIEVATLSEDELERELLWQPRLLEFDAAPLESIVSEFNRRNPVQIAIDDRELESISLSSAFWSDNVEGFVRLMESSFGMKAEWVDSQQIVLRKRENKRISN